jgi:hypothetical protein
MPTIHAVITKQFTFRGKPERWSNGYNLQSTATIDAAYLKSVCDALVTMERDFTLNDVSYVYSVAGLLGQDALYAEEYASPQVGIITSSTSQQHPESCVLAQSQFGPRRFVMKYYHGTAWAPSGKLSDVLDSATKTRIEGDLVKLTNGTLPGAATYCRPNGALITSPFKCDPYVRTHQLKRRGKRRA